MLAATPVAAILVLLTIAIHYEALRITSEIAPRLHLVHPRARLVFIVVAAFAAHIFEIWLWALGYFACVQWLGIGSFGGVSVDGLGEMVYFSVVSYTTLGLGEIYPIDGLRLLTGIESLIGLMMITWTASFTYLTMEKYWPLHREQRQHRHEGS